MRVMMIVKATQDSEAGIMPHPELFEEMAKFNQEMMDAGIWVDATGLQPSSKGVRVNISGNKRSVVNGPFAETTELIAGYWIIDVASLDEAIDWAKRSPHPHPGHDTHIEIRRFFGPEDFA